MLNQKKLDTKMLDSLKWKHLGSKTGSTPIALPSGWKELLVHIGKDAMYTPYYVANIGVYNNGRFSNNNGQQAFTVTEDSVSITIFYVGSTNSLSSGVIEAWYR